MNRMSLRSGLNRSFAERAYYVPKIMIMTYLDGSEVEAKILLEEWDERGYLRIVANLEEIGDKDICVELLDWIEDPRSGENPRRL